MSGEIYDTDRQEVASQGILLLIYTLIVARAINIQLNISSSMHGADTNSEQNLFKSFTVNMIISYASKIYLRQCS